MFKRIRKKKKQRKKEQNLIPGLDLFTNVKGYWDRSNKEDNVFTDGMGWKGLRINVQGSRLTVLG